MSTLPQISLLVWHTRVCGYKFDGWVSYHLLNCVLEVRSPRLANINQHSLRDFNIMNPFFQTLNFRFLLDIKSLKLLNVLRVSWCLASVISYLSKLHCFVYSKYWTPIYIKVIAFNASGFSLDIKAKYSYIIRFTYTGLLRCQRMRSSTV